MVVQYRRQFDNRRWQQTTVDDRAEWLTRYGTSRPDKSRCGTMQHVRRGGGRGRIAVCRARAPENTIRDLLYCVLIRIIIY